MAALKPPFRAADMQGLFRSVQKGLFERIPVQYSNDLQKIISLCLNLNPIQRPSSDDLLNNPLVQQHQQYVVQEQQAVDIANTFKSSGGLLDTIRLPHNLQQLKENLPKPQYKKKQPVKLTAQYIKEIDQQQENKIPGGANTQGAGGSYNSRYQSHISQRDSRYNNQNQYQNYSLNQKSSNSQMQQQPSYNNLLQQQQQQYSQQYIKNQISMYTPQYQGKNPINVPYMRNPVSQHQYQYYKNPNSNSLNYNNSNQNDTELDTLRKMVESNRRPENHKYSNYNLNPSQQQQQQLQYNHLPTIDELGKRNNHNSVDYQQQQQAKNNQMMVKRGGGAYGGGGGGGVYEQQYYQQQQGGDGTNNGLSMETQGMYTRKGASNLRMATGQNMLNNQPNWWG